MSDERDPDKERGPGGIPMRELHELVKRSHARDQNARAPDKLEGPLAALLRLGQEARLAGPPSHYRYPSED